MQGGEGEGVQQAAVEATTAEDTTAVFNTAPAAAAAAKPTATDLAAEWEDEGGDFKITKVGIFDYAGTLEHKKYFC